MRRVGYIIEEIVEPSNMEASFRQVLRGSKRKRSRQGGYLLAHKPEVLEELAAQIASGTFRVKDYREREIIEGGKLRRIQVIPMKDRIAVHAIMAVVPPSAETFHPYHLRQYQETGYARPPGVCPP